MFTHKKAGIPMVKQALRMNDKDNVVTAVTAVEAHDQVHVMRKDGSNVGTIEAREAIERYHKLALHDIAAGELVTKYGQTIGRATQSIQQGEHVHTHNIESVKTHD